nr:DNA mismatch repair endonuclease MutL [Pirellula staleyi]
MPTIRQLSTSVINKIAAGEVIERPASVVKELLENAVDAGATRIDVHLESGGCDLVRITDNGCGIEPEQLMLAVASHATSKIVDADDLFRVATLGFRGEALASIAEISQLTIRSRTADSTEGAELVVHGGVAQPIMPCAAPIGTTLEVRNLFFNTPVRRKFLRQAQTEIGHCTEAFTRIALASEHIHFTLRHNERLLFDLPAGDWRRRIGLLIGKEIELALIPIEAADDSTKLYGYTCDPQQNRSSNKLQYLFLNGRHIRDRSLQHALSEAYRGLLLTGRFPICFLRIEMPADTVDVNVHPSKLEVRFQDGGRLYSMILGTLRKKFLATDLTARLHRPQGATETATSSMDESALAAHRRELVDWAKGALGQPTSGALSSSRSFARLACRALRTKPRSSPLAHHHCAAGELPRAVCRQLCQSSVGRCGSCRIPSVSGEFSCRAHRPPCSTRSAVVGRFAPRSCARRVHGCFAGASRIARRSSATGPRRAGDVEHRFSGPSALSGN